MPSVTEYVGTNQVEQILLNTKPKPTVLPVVAENIPEELRAQKRWVAWKLKFKNGRWTKVPYDANCNPRHKPEKASSTDHNTWTAFGVALQYYREREDIDGIGFVLSHKVDEIVGGDFDHCVSPVGIIDDVVRKHLTNLDTYAELSPSGTGTRWFARGKLPDGKRHDANTGTEIYDGGRFLTITGHKVEGTPSTVNNRPREIAAFHKAVFGSEQKPVTPKTKLNLAMAQDGPSLSDNEIVELANKAKNGDKFKKLFHEGADAKRHSEDDQALCNMLAFYTGDFDQIDRLVSSSALYREKWDRPDYKQRTINNALASVTERYNVAARRHEEERVQLTAMEERAVAIIQSAANEATDTSHPRAATRPVDGSIVPELRHDPDMAFADPAIDGERPRGQKKATASKPARRGLTLSELMKLPAPEWLVRKHYCRQSLNLIVGPSGAGKSFFALDMALSATFGMPLFDTFQTKESKVAYIYSEGQFGLKYRMMAWMREHGVDELPDTIRFYPYRYDFLSDEDVSSFIAQSVEDFGIVPDIVFIDTLNRNFGGGDENSTKDMSIFVTGTDSIRERGSVVNVVHHTGKDGSKGERGSTALRGAADNVFFINKQTEGTMKVSCEKMKDGEAFKDYYLTAKSHLLGVDSDGVPITSLAFVMGDKDAVAGIEKSEDLSKLNIGEEGITIAQAEIAWSVSTATARRKLNKMVEAGTLVVRKADGGLKQANRYLSA